MTAGDKKLLDQYGKPIRSVVVPTTEKDRDEYRHVYDPNNKKKEFSDKIYLFPESYNALRREIHDNWPTLWSLVSWRMANDAQEFIEYMNEATDLAIVFDTEKVAWICDQYLTKLRRMRGLSG